MAGTNWIDLLVRQSAPDLPVGWDEVVVGHDFGILGPEEIRCWAQTQAVQGPHCRALVALADTGLEGFEEALWAACAEAVGKVPRPGERRWSRAQDRWRLALLKEAMVAPLSSEALAVAVESIYERVGCPEDMLGLWHRHSPWQGLQGGADHQAIVRFVKRCETDLLAAV
jgi:hypothetical protein